MFELIPQVHHQVMELRRVVGGELHDEGCDLAAHGGLPHERDHDDRHRHAEHVQREHQQIGVDARVLRGDRSAHSGEDGRLCAAGEERYDAVRHDPFLFVGERPCIDRRGNGTAEAHDHRDERAAGEPEFAERPVQNERHARHVARIFQNGDKEEQDEDLRDEGQNARKARPNTVVDETLRPCRGAHVFQARGDEPADLVGDEAHQVKHDCARRRYAVRRIEHGDERAQNLVAGIDVRCKPCAAVEPARDRIDIQQVGAECQVKDGEQNHQKDGDTPDTVGEHLIRLVRLGEGFLLFRMDERRGEVRGYVLVALVGDHRLEIALEHVVLELLLEFLHHSDFVGVVFDLQLVPFH